MPVIESREQADVLRQQHGIAEHVAGHVADAGDREVLQQRCRHPQRDRHGEHIHEPPTPQALARKEREELAKALEAGVPPGNLPKSANYQKLFQFLKELAGT